MRVNFGRRWVAKIRHGAQLISGQMEFHTLPETNIAPETVGLKDEFPSFQKASWEGRAMWTFGKIGELGDFLNLILVGASNSVDLPFLAGLSPAAWAASFWSHGSLA